MPKSVIIAGTILAGVVCCAAFLFFKQNGSAPKSEPQTVQSPDAIAVPKPLREVQGIGYVEPVSEMRNLSFKGSGIIAECRVEIGQPVRAGDVLMVLNDVTERKGLAVAEQEFELAKVSRENVLAGVDKFEIAAAEQGLEVARQRLSFAEKESRRINELTEKNVSTKSEQDQSTSKYKQALAEARQAQSQLSHLEHFVTPERKLVAEREVSLSSARRELAAETLADTKLVAPANGTILEILRREGEAVSREAHEPTIVFGDMSHLRVRAEIDERYVRRVKAGQPVKVFGRTLNDQIYRGKVVLVKDVMGKKTVFTRSSAERKDLDVVQVLIEMGQDFTAPAGLRVDVTIEIGS